MLKDMLHRRSVRKFTDEKVSEEDIKTILAAGLSSASGKGARPWELVVIEDKDVLAKIGASRNPSMEKMTGGAACAIAVFGIENGLEGGSDTWIEDCSIVLSNMHLMADYLGLGSCWIQGRLRSKEENLLSSSYMEKLLNAPEGYHYEACLIIGHTDSHPAARTVDELPFEKVHYKSF